MFDSYLSASDCTVAPIDLPITNDLCFQTAEKSGINTDSIDNSFSVISSTDQYMANETDIHIKRMLDFLDSNYRQRLILLIYGDTFEPGTSNSTIEYVKSLFRYGENAVVLWLTKLYNENLNNAAILCGILHINIYFHDIFSDVGTIMAMAAMTNKSQEVKELGVRVLESNCNLENLRALKSIQCEEKWLMEYIEQVISDFESELCQR